MRIPQTTSIESIIQWENGYFESEFTHPYEPARLTSFPGGFAALWGNLIDSDAGLPSSTLATPIRPCGRS